MSKLRKEGRVFGGTHCDWCALPLTTKTEVAYFDDHGIDKIVELCAACAARVIRCTDCGWFDRLIGGEYGKCLYERRAEPVDLQQRCHHWCQAWSLSEDGLTRRLAREQDDFPNVRLVRYVRFVRCASSDCEVTFEKQAPNHRFCSARCRKREDSRARRTRKGMARGR